MPDSQPARRRDPVLRWAIGDHDLQIQARYLYAANAVYVHWGDASQRETLGVNMRLFHSYAQPGAYWLKLMSLGGLLLAQAQVIVRAARRPQVTLERDPVQPRGMIASAPAQLDSTGLIPHYRVYWDYYDDPSIYDEWWGLAGSNVRRVLAAGVYTARVVDQGSLGWFEHQFAISAPDLDFTISAAGRTATLTVAQATEGKALVVAWGDATLTEVVSSKTATHTYPSDVDDTYIVQLAYADGSGTPAIKTVAIPGGSS